MKVCDAWERAGRGKWFQRDKIQPLASSAKHPPGRSCEGRGADSSRYALISDAALMRPSYRSLITTDEYIFDIILHRLETSNVIVRDTCESDQCDARYRR